MINMNIIPIIARFLSLAAVRGRILIDAGNLQLGNAPSCLHIYAAYWATRNPLPVQRRLKARVMGSGRPGQARGPSRQ
jgi:hypothetical protein